MNRLVLAALTFLLSACGNVKATSDGSNGSGDGGDCSACGSANATASCNEGMCVVTCNPGWANCNGDNGDGCESPVAIAEVSVGADHTCAWKQDGTLWCWGKNDYGQLGIGNTTNQLSPVQVTSLGNSVVQVAANSSTGFTCARKQDGTLWCWGNNELGTLGTGNTANQFTPVQVTALGNSVVEVATASAHTCARKQDGTLWCWGAGTFGDLGIGNTTDQLSPVQVTALGTSVAQVSAMGPNTCARKTDGTLWCWGYNGSGQLGIGNTTSQSSPVQVTTLTAVAEVSAGFFHTCAVRNNQTLWCWGSNQYGQLGIGSTTSQSSPTQVAVLGGSVIHVSAGNKHTCARKDDGTLWCWGDNASGELGTGNTTSQTSPVQVTMLDTMAAQVSVGNGTTCATKRDATLWCWGDNVDGQLGIGNTNGQLIPTQLTLPCP